jgi:hypothetical protein
VYKTEIIGQCHCGAIHFNYRSNRNVEDLPLRKCDCTFCTKHNCLYSGDGEGEFTYMENEARAKHYQFGHSTALFHICKSCGVMPFVTCKIDGKEYAVVNMCCATSHSFSDQTATTKSFEGESSEKRLARRKKSWTPIITDQS